MGRYAEFETTRDLYRGLLTTVSVANRSGGADEAYVVKLYEPGSAVTGKAGVDREAKLFLERAEAMRALTEAGAKHWLPLHALGLTEGGAFYAADRCPRTLEQLINGRVKLDGPGMFNVIRSVWEGLRELQRLKGRPHGMVKPTNVLLDRVGQVEKARVMLADPAPLTGLDSAEAELDDIRALGRLVFQLVFFQPFRERGGYPVSESAEWSKLGKKGEDWRNFCNMVLDPAVRSGQLTLEGLAGDIEALRDGRSGGGGLPLVPLGVTAAALTIVGVGGFVLVSQMFAGEEGEEGATVAPGEVEVRFSEERWAQWCEVHAEFRDMALLLLRERELVASDPFLAERVLADLEEMDGALSPHIVRGGRGSRRPTVRPEDTIPDEARTAEGVRKMAEAIARLEAYPDAFGAEDWEARETVDRLASRLREAGLHASWRTVEGWLREALAQQSGAGERASAILAILRAAEYVPRAEAALDRLASAAARLEASGDDRIGVAMTMARLADERLEGSGTPRLEDLAELLERQAGVVMRLAELIETRFEGSLPEQFVETSRFGRQLASLQDEGETDPEIWERALRGYLVEYERYDLPVDPLVPSPVRAEWLAQSEAQIERARTLLRTVGDELALGDESELAAGELDSEQRSDYFEQLGAISRRVDELEGRRAELAPRGGEVRQSELAELRELSDRVRTDLEGVVQQVAVIERDLMRSTIDAEAIIEDLRGRASVAGVESGAVNEAFAPARDGIIDRYRSDGNAAALQSEANRLDELLRRIDTLARETTPRLTERPSRFDEGAWGELVRARVERTAGSMVGAAGVADRVARGEGVPSLSEGDVRSLEAFTRARADAERLQSAVATSAQLEAILDSAAPLDREPASTALVRFDEMRSAEELRELEPVLQPLAARVEQLVAVSALDDHARLLDGASNTSDVPLAMASWRRLSTLPARSATLGAEAEALADLRQAIDLIDHGQASEELASELASIGRTRWKGAVAAASNRRELADSLRLAARLDVEPDAADLPDPVRYNIELLRLEESWRQRAESPDEAWVRERADAFVARVDGLALGEQQREFIAEMVRVAEGEASSGTDYTQVGPGLHGWTPEPVGDGIVRFVSPWGRAVEFARVPGVSDDEGAVYLSREEVSIGLFSEVVARAGAWERVTEQWQENPIDLQRNRSVGGQNARLLSYRYDPVSGELTPTSSWMPDFEPHFRDIDFYPRGERPDNPTLDHPMHMVSVVAADRFVELMGCRLPTDEEWRAAVDFEREQGELSGNLRDAAWLGQHEWVRQLDAQRAFDEVQAPYPDNGIFTPPRAQVPVGSDAVPAVRDDDGSVWFERVGRSGRGERFYHLLGNVAEFVVAPGLPQEHGVIGGSALSPAQADPETVYGLLPFQRRVAYSDVGFRLSFSTDGAAQEQSSADRLARLVDQAVFSFGG
ncbi:MAG: SUMF1/EgtB/PvdO family nonheme iron enzyme [Phycisphaerales bacterium]|nr:SUMF1/EgtB/PvdO family nonheme iron enzyme [Phycisphaerales bacterium]